MATLTATGVLCAAVGVLTQFDLLTSHLPVDAVWQKWMLLAGLAAPSAILAAFGQLLDDAPIRLAPRAGERRAPTRCA